MTELRGWSEDLGECREFSDLPAAAREYLDFVADRVGVPVAMVGVGPEQDQIIWTDASRQTIIGRNGSVPSQ